MDDETTQRRTWNTTQELHPVKVNTQYAIHNRKPVSFDPRDPDMVAFANIAQMITYATHLISNLKYGEWAEEASEINEIISSIWKGLQND